MMINDYTTIQHSDSKGTQLSKSTYKNLYLPHLEEIKNSDNYRINQ